MEPLEAPFGGGGEAAAVQPAGPVTLKPQIHPTTAILKNALSASVLKPVTVFRPVGAIDANALISAINQPAQIAKTGLTPIQVQNIFKFFPLVIYTLPLGSSFKTAQQQNFAVSVHFDLLGGATTINFSYSGLPAGVTPVTSSVNFAAWASRRIFLNFTVSDDAPLVDNHHFTIHYSAYNGLRQADIPITLTIWSGFPMQHQQQSNWCWAAVSTSVDHWYNPSSTVTQCQVVNQQVGRNDCCQNGGSSNCNVYGFLDQALGYVGRLDHVDSSTESYATVVGQVVTFHPLGIRVAWSGGGAHFIAATGHEQGDMVVIDDPIYGTSVVYYTTLMGTYQGSGNWTHSYFTKS